ncbi:MFS transporter [Umezawaea tangerina]|uniref:Putative MFS family arabinose efflux permease n=1 Tax=Umezawaea tangerina TaxID=84725 RepID=A0A2T0TKD6_9PSEU|nr:MFS transporter [Umezawaea tangerina]PRY46182.1 putative MFS family arabinose efflux permease [Umezawaea tangerina]
MSHSARLADYRAALTTPGMRGPVIAAVLARLPIAMVGLSLLLYVQRTTGSFAIAGLVSAGSLVGVAVGAVVQGRLMDRFGPTRPLLAVIALFAVFVAVSITAVEAHAPVAVLLPLAFGVGFTEPMVGSASRALWSRMVPPGSTRLAGYAYEAISMEVFFILGPGLSGILVAAPWAGTGVVVGAVCMVVGGTWFALNPTVRGVRPAAVTGRKLLGALASPGMRTVALAALGFGVTIGFIEVAVPAAAANAGHVSLGGLLLSAWSISSVVFGVLYAMRPFPKSMHLRLPALLGGFGALSLLLAVPTSLFWLGAAMLVVGTMVTPQATTHSAAIEQVAPKGTATEAFGWVVTAVTVGLAIGQSISGYLVEHVGTPVAFLAAGGSGLFVAALVWLFRGTVAAGVPAEVPAVRREEMDLASR